MKVKVTQEQLEKVRGLYEDKKTKKAEPLTKDEIKILELLHKKEIPTNSSKTYLDKIGFAREEALEIALIYFFNERPEGGYADIKTPLREPDIDYHEVPNTKSALYLHLIREEPEDLHNFMDIERGDYEHYGLDMYNVGENEEYAVGDEQDVENAFTDFADSVADEWENWFEARDLISWDVVEFDNDFIGDEVNHYVDDMDDYYVLQYIDKDDEYDELEEKWDEKIEAADEKEQEELISQQTKVLEDFIDEAREEMRDGVTDEWEREFDDDPIDWFYNHWGIGESEAVDSYGYINDRRLRDEIEERWDRGEALGSYDGNEREQEYDGEEYYIYKVG